MLISTFFGKLAVLLVTKVPVFYLSLINTYGGEAMNIGVAGLGLIGGSLCKAVKAYTPHSVYGADIDPEVIANALQYGAIDAELTPEFLQKCDIMISALYPNDTIEYVKKNLSHFKNGAVILDVCGVKSNVCAAINELLKDNTAVFVGGHPMAGREFSGFAASCQDLFKGASMVLTPADDTDKAVLDMLTGFISSLGFAKIINTSPAFHDKMIAYTSQLPHVIASSYVKSPNCKYQLGFTGGSFEDMSRVARLNENMWTELFIENSACLVSELDTFIDNLAEMRDAIASGDTAKLRGLLAQGRHIKEELQNGD